jgi:hypothetical protein
MLTLEVDAVLGPQPLDDLEAFVGLPPTRLHVDVQRRPLRPHRTADAEGRQQPALGQHIDRCALFGDEHWIAQCERHHVHAELDATRPPGKRRHGRHALKDRRAADKAVGLPDGVGAASLTQVDPSPVAARVSERKFHQSEADGDTHG